MTLYYSTFETPLGNFSAAVDSTGRVIATAFGDASALAERISSTDAARLVPNHHRLAVVRTEVLEYCGGGRRTFSVRLATTGTPFQQRVWHALTQIPPGSVRSYAELARALGSSPRAVGGANAANPICLLVPCHRVIGADGTMTGFAFGADLKRRLLEHEGWRPPARG